MKQLLPIVSMLGLALVIGPPVFYLAGVQLIGEEGKATMTMIMLVGTLVWFITTPFWMRPPGADNSEN